MALGDRLRTRMAEKTAQQDRGAAPAAADAPAAPAPPVDPMERLKELGELHEQGILTDEEFAAEKAKVLNG